MKFKLLAIAAVMAVSGAANAAAISNGTDGNGGLFFSAWDATSSYSLNLNTTIDSFQSSVAAAGLVDLSWAADVNFTSFMSTADMASLKWNIVAVDNAGARRVLETYTTMPAATKTMDVVRTLALSTNSYVTTVNTALAGANSVIIAAGVAGYAGTTNKFSDNGAGLLNFSNAGSFATNSSATGLNFMRIDALATTVNPSTYTQYTDSGSDVKVYLDSANALHIAAVAAVPEPETYAMLMAGLGLMGAIARRRNKKSA